MPMDSQPPRIPTLHACSPMRWAAHPRRRAGLCALGLLVWLAMTLGPPAAAAQDPVAEAPAPESGAGAPVNGVPSPAAATPIAATTVAEPARPPLEEPADLRDVDAWIAWKSARHMPALPFEARLFFRQGLLARQANRNEDAVRLVRGAADLDPGFLQPHLTLASWWLTREPSQALLQYAAALELVRQSFDLQVELAANAFLFLLEALFAGLLFTAMLVVWARRDELLHGSREALARHISPGSARGWSWALLVLPYATGFGFTLPSLVALGYLWSHLRLRERTLFVLLALAAILTPLTRTVMQRFTLPIRSDSAPFYGTAGLANENYTPDRLRQLVQAAQAHPDNAFLAFGAGWTAQRGHELEIAERNYRHALELWPSADRVLNNLGNAVAMQGRADEALEIYAKAVETDPLNAAAWFNQAQLYTQRFQFQQSSEAMARASALNFEMVKAYQAQSSDDGLLPLVDQWIEPRVSWAALERAPLSGSPGGAVPLALRRHVEMSGWSFAIAALLAAAFGVALGRWRERQLPLRTCGNCGAVVCRRCARRRRESGLCPACAAVETEADNAEFSGVVLSRHRQRVLHRRHLVRTALAAILPGYGLIAHRHVFTAIALTASTWALLRASAGWLPPYAVEPRLMVGGGEVPFAAILAGLVLVWTISLAAYFALVARERDREEHIAAAARGRVTQATRRTPAAA